MLTLPVLSAILQVRTSCPSFVLLGRPSLRGEQDTVGQKRLKLAVCFVHEKLIQADSESDVQTESIPLTHFDDDKEEI